MKKNRRKQRMNQELKAALYVVIGHIVSTMLLISGVHMKLFGYETPLKCVVIVIAMIISICFVIYGANYLDKHI